MDSFNQTKDSTLQLDRAATVASEQAYLDKLIDQALEEAFETSDAIDFAWVAELAKRRFNAQRTR